MRVHDFLQFDDDVRPLSGKTIIAVIAYFVPGAPSLIAAGVLTALGVLGTFPTSSRSVRRSSETGRFCCIGSQLRPTARA